MSKTLSMKETGTGTGNVGGTNLRRFAKEGSLLDSVFAPPTRLNLHVVCTEGIPVAEMLANFLHLPLIVMYGFEEF